MSSIVEVRDLWKKYDEDWVLKNIHLEINKGEILGIIGENGAGKSTLIQHILGLIKPTKGEILIHDVPIAKDEISAKKSLSYIPELPLLYKDLTVWEHLKFVAMAFEMEENEFVHRGTNLLKRFGIWEKKNMIPSNFSKGMRQKVAVCCALIHDADILLIDEPFTGLDVRAVRDLKTIIADLHQEGKTIIIATHILDAAEKMCERFMILRKGEILAKGSLHEIKRQTKLAQNSSLEDIYFALWEGGDQTHE
ncbi:ABC transporter ATP-binding protein [Irregularibacter muris]|uniref:ABC transporter ATP-binding protein n=1 Tax=Irregularibacter muris TaxID=1796619 RepID=A0AAE3HIW5_9FIRM|nr:ABC transporter ATP-binding protein [Irregularibacter muris]MCR1899674.1 ABC transporter ATP-binding protein [Irregularibacter muris]